MAVSSVPVPARSWMSRVFPPLWRRDPELLWPYLLRWTISPAHRVLARSAGYGADRVPLEGGIVFAANHLSAIDPTLLGAFVPRAVYYMAKVELLAMPFFGEILQWTGAFPIRRSEGDREALRLARELVAEGHSLGMFAEGTRQRLGYPGPVQPGALMIAVLENVPVVPCGLYSFGWSLGSRASCAVVFGEPMTLEGVPRSGRGYKETAELVGAALLGLWRQAAEAVARGFPDEPSDGTPRGAPVPPFKRMNARGPA